MPRGLSNKQKDFCQGVAAGVDRIDAALAAGYTKATAANVASQLMHRSDIKAEIARLQGGGKTKNESGSASDTDSYLKEKYKDPLSLMVDLMNNPRAPTSLRYAAAKDALPYMHAKLGEQGKKAAADEAAKGVAKGKRFAVPKGPTRLHAVK